MAAIQNFKNFLRHGKQARAPPDEATTKVSNVHATTQRHPQEPNQHAFSQPDLNDHKPLANVHPQGDFSVGAGPGDNRNIAAQAGDAAARAAGQKHKADVHKQAGSTDRKDADPTVLERIVAEEREARGKLPKYPGLERWTLLEKMGDGAFSNVYRAKDNNGQYDEVAIKVVRKFEMNSSQGDNHMHPDFKKAPKTVERANILKEVQIMRQLDHPNIVRLVDFSESRQYYYIVLELCPGGELFHQIVRLTYFSEDLSRHVIIQVAKALEYLHEDAGVVHRDIKPENLLFYPTPFVPTRNPKPRGPDDEDKADEGEFIRGVGAGGIGVIKIADFGLSKVIWDSQTMTPCGTVGYTAPEIVKDERYSKSVDMWAMGCVLYTLLCGFPPFYDESIQTLTEKVARGQYTFLSPWWDDISKPAQDLVSHLLTVDPEKRYDIKQFLNHPWIREADEMTYAAHDAPPLATPLVARQKQFEQGKADPLQQNFAYLESPGARRMDFRSPGAVNLREVFDVGYAVHRQEEEGKRRKNFKQGYRGANAMNSLNVLDENEDDDEFGADTAPDDAGQQHPPAKLPKSQNADVSAMEQKLRNTTLSAAAQARQGAAPAKTQERGYGQHSPAVAAAARRQVKQKGAFELSLESSSLLARRHKKAPEPSSLRDELSAGGT
ncbi:kinase-like domain-containing protein [Massariosphaeria phaeospora]|uniref:Kinase-like domain-containing protein n=1 Tax=Massariosphaeria phaeospora TaxID=100035 RepID=A0A7C8MKY8_9PLEO|nr:kinase-like domain-containing protein [Massariosphaeria phaeospora]